VILGILVIVAMSGRQIIARRRAVMENRRMYEKMSKQMKGGQ
jgi:hypothetical protein